MRRLERTRGEKRKQRKQQKQQKQQKKLRRPHTNTPLSPARIPQRRTPQPRRSPRLALPAAPKVPVVGRSQPAVDRAPAEPKHDPRPWCRLRQPVQRGQRMRLRLCVCVCVCVCVSVSVVVVVRGQARQGCSGHELQVRGEEAQARDDGAGGGDARAIGKQQARRSGCCCSCSRTCFCSCSCCCFCLCSCCFGPSPISAAVDLNARDVCPGQHITTSSAHRRRQKIRHGRRAAARIIAALCGHGQRLRQAQAGAVVAGGHV